MIIKKYRISIAVIRTISSRVRPEKPVRVRFAPSPTGDLHLGSLRTALFNFLYARKYHGSFILRLEDTDRDRIVPGVEHRIEDTLNYFGLKLDESPRIGGNFGPYKQSERFLYNDVAEQLIGSGHAYKCFCSLQRLEILRKKCASEKITPRYDGLCRTLLPAEINARERDGQVPVIRFKYDPGEMTFNDMIFGACFHKWEETDFIIIKRDGFPTYHFANVVDDKQMEISTVMRGSEWLVSTPKHLKIYSALNWSPPSFAHLPLITQDGHKKLSKRNKSSYVNFYTDLGYLPIAVLNFLLRNGNGIRNHDTHRLYNLDEMVQDFDEGRIGKANFMMDLKELDRYGKMAFQMADFEGDILPVVKLLFSILPQELRSSIKEDLLNKSYYEKVINFLKANEETFSKLSDIVTGDFRFFFMKPNSCEKLLQHFPETEETIGLLDELCIYLDKDKFTFNNLKQLASEKQTTPGKVTCLIRLSVIDNVSGPPIDELLEFFGKDEIKRRITHMISNLKKCKNKHAAESYCSNLK